MSFETVNAFRAPAMFKGPMKFHPQGLESHPGFKSVRSFGAPPHKPVYLFFDIYEWLFHRAATIGSVVEQSKPPRQL